MNGGLRTTLTIDFILKEYGFDKRILASDKKTIKAELRRLHSVIEQGGYIPDCDHSVPVDVSWENTCCYVETLKSMYGT